MFSSNLPSSYQANQITSTLQEYRARDLPLCDLTASNPAAVGLTPALLADRHLAAVLAAGAAGYDPQPLGAAAARAAVAAYYAEVGCAVAPEQVVLTASTSEAYGWVCKLLCLPDQQVLVPAPGYPLCADICRLEGVHAVLYRLRPSAPESGTATATEPDTAPRASWVLDRASVMAGLAAGARAVIAIHPHNPTGSYLSAADLLWLAEQCARHDAALIVDEVFADYSWRADARIARDYARLPGLTLVLNGMSKTCAAPQLKCGWIAVFGPPALVTAALQHIEYIADTYLSVSGAAQAALPALLRARTDAQRPILQRVRANVVPAAALATAATAAATAAAAHGTGAVGASSRASPSGGGWWYLLQLPAAIDDAAFALRLLREHRTLVHPGYLFEAAEPAIAVSLIVAPAPFAAGMQSIAAALR